MELFSQMRKSKCRYCVGFIAYVHHNAAHVKVDSTYKKHCIWTTSASHDNTRSVVNGVGNITALFSRSEEFNG